MQWRHQTTREGVLLLQRYFKPTEWLYIILPIIFSLSRPNLNKCRQNEHDQFKSNSIRNAEWIKRNQYVTNKKQPHLYNRIQIKSDKFLLFPNKGKIIIVFKKVSNYRVYSMLWQYLIWNLSRRTGLHILKQIYTILTCIYSVLISITGLCLPLEKKRS